MAKPEKKCGKCRFFSSHSSTCKRTKLEFPSEKEDYACGQFALK